MKFGFTSALRRIMKKERVLLLKTSHSNALIISRSYLIRKRSLTVYMLATGLLSEELRKSQKEGIYLVEVSVFLVSV